MKNDTYAKGSRNNNSRTFSSKKSNSRLKDAINPNRIFSEIQMERSKARTNKQKEKAYLLVEGETDRRFYKNLVYDSKIIKDCKGKENVIGLIEKFNKGMSRGPIKGILGIVDKDYDCYLGKNSYPDNIIVTDTHDMETMILRTPVRSRLYSELLDEDKLLSVDGLEQKSIDQKIFHMAKYLGITRLILQKENIDLSVNDVEIKHYVADDFSFQLELWVKAILYPIGRISEKKRILDEIIVETENSYDIWQIARGHDLCELLAIYLSADKLGYKYLSRTDIETNLRVSYSLNDFFETELGKKMIEWQQKNIEYQILKNCYFNFEISMK